MALSDMKVYNEYIKAAAIETVCQEIDKFNAASGGAIVLSAEGFDGDFKMESMFASLESAQRRVDRYGVNGVAPVTDLSQIEQVLAKIAGGFGPVKWEPSQLTWMQQNPSLGIEMASRVLSEAILKDQLNTGILAAVAAVGNNSGTVFPATTNVTQVGLNQSHALFGDRSQALVAQVMTGATYHGLIGEALNNANALFSSDTVTVINILGKRIVVTDAPALLDGTTGNVLSLQNAGIVVENASDLVTNINTDNGNIRIETTFQADYAFGLGIKGYAWDVANGGKSPDDTDIGTGTNWDKFVTCDKDTAGVLLTFDTTA